MSPELGGKTELLDLCEDVLDHILKVVGPRMTIQMATVSKAFNRRCGGDRIWKQFFDQKWGELVRPVVHPTLVPKDIATRSCWYCDDFPDLQQMVKDNFLFRPSFFVVDRSYLSCFTRLESGKFSFMAFVCMTTGEVARTFVTYQRHTDTFDVWGKPVPYDEYSRHWDREVTWCRLKPNFQT